MQFNNLQHSEDLNKSGIELISSKFIRKPEINLLTQNTSYELIKAQSDLLELKRDLSLFEYSFILYNDFSRFFNKAYHYQNKISQVFNKTKIPSTKSLLENINKEVSKQIILDYNKKIEKIDIFVESFIILPSNTLKFIENYSGIIEISEIRCHIQLESRIRKYHNIKCFADSKLMILNLEQNLNGLLCASNNYKEMIKILIFPYLWINTLKGEYSLYFSKNIKKHEKYIVLIIKGLGLVTLKITITYQQLLVEIPYSSISLILELSKFQSLLNWFEVSLKVSNKNPFTNNLKNLKNLLKSKLIFSKNRFLWLEHENCFENREKFSPLMNKRFLFSIFHFYMKKICRFYLRIKGKMFKIICYDNLELRISHQEQRIVINEKVPEFFELFNLQSERILFSPITLMKSLELKFLLIKLFNY